MITDKEISELWQLVVRKRTWPIPLHIEIRCLIYEIIKERNKNLFGHGFLSEDRGLKYTLDHFNISEKEFKETYGNSNTK